MSRLSDEPGRLPGTTTLKDRLNRIRKRKRAFGGQVVDMEALRRRLLNEQQRKRER